MPSIDPTVQDPTPRSISDIDRLMRRSDKTTPCSAESLLKATMTGMERRFRNPATLAPALHLWTATGYRFFHDGTDGLASPLESLPKLWNEVLPVLVADTRATRLAHGQVLYVPASMYREDPNDEYGCYFASAVAVDGHGFHRRANCPVVPADGGFRRMADWSVSDPPVSDYADALENPSRVIAALIHQERPVQVTGLVEVSRA